MSDQFEQLDIPLDPLPPNFIQQVMARVARTKQFTPPPYRLQFLDMALALFVTLVVAVVMGLSLWFSGHSLEGIPIIDIDLPYIASFGWVVWGLGAQLLVCVLIGVGLWMNNTLDELN